MFKKGKKIFKNNLLNNHTNWSIFFLILWGFFFTEVIATILIDVPISLLTDKIYIGIGATVSSLLVLLLHKRRFYPEYSGSLTCGNTKTALKLSVFFIAYLGYSSLYSIIKMGFDSIVVYHTTKHIITFTIMSLMAGFAEETIFRGLIVSYLMRQWKNKKNYIKKIMIVSSALFGLIHFSNMLMTKNNSYIFLQVISAFCIGLFFCALFLRSGLLWPAIILHFMNDLFAFYFTDDYMWENLSIFSMPVSNEMFFDLFLCILLGILSFYLIRPSKHQEIDELWSKKWQPISPENTVCTYRNETKKDYHRVEKMTRNSFWNVYAPGCEEHYLLHCFRDKPEFVKELDIVMEINGSVKGHVMFVKSCIKTDDGKEVQTLTLGPICIDNQYKRKGFGLMILNYAIEQAKTLGYGAILLEGNPDFYGKVGFETATKHGIRLASDLESDAPYFMVNILKEGFLDGIKGIYTDPEGYFVAKNDPKKFMKFDRKFPKKKKLKLPGQLV